MLGSMNVYPRTHLAGDILPCCPVHNLLNCKVVSSFVLLMKERRCQENLNGARNINKNRL
jgi:hypothetical protein